MEELGQPAKKGSSMFEKCLTPRRIIISSMTLAVMSVIVGAIVSDQGIAGTLHYYPIWFVVPAAFLKGEKTSTVGDGSSGIQRRPQG